MIFLRGKSSAASPIRSSLKSEGGDIMYYVYILKSLKDGSKYIGQTRSIENRLEEHNRGYVTSTANKKPFKLVSYIAVENRNFALKLEKYLKTGSGRAFIEKHLL